MTGIYKITNKITGDCYIGQSIDIEKRWKEHINSSKNKNSSEYQKILYRAFRKYGVNNFTFEILETCKRKILTEREVFWYNKFIPRYNAIFPNQPISEIQKQKVHKIDIKTKKIIETYESVREAGRKNNVSKTAILNVCNGIRNSANGYYWVKESDYKFDIEPPKDKGNNGSRRKEILVINKDTLLVEKTFDSIHETARHFGVTHSSIRWRCVTNNFKSDVNGCYFRFKDNCFCEIDT